MKGILLLLLLIITASSIAQQTQEQLRKEALEKATDYKEWDSSKINHQFKIIKINPVTKGQIANFCDFVEAQELDFEKKLLELSGVTKAEKGTMIAILKVQKFWSLYKDSCYCNTELMSVKDGNILLMAVTSGFLGFFNGLILDYGININYIDKIHNLTVLDYTLNEINRLEKSGGQKVRVDELKGIYEYLKKELGCKHKWEL